MVSGVMALSKSICLLVLIKAALCLAAHSASLWNGPQARLNEYRGKDPKVQALRLFRKTHLAIDKENPLEL